MTTTTSKTTTSINSTTTITITTTVTTTTTKSTTTSSSDAKKVLPSIVVIAGYFGINPPGFVAEVVAFAFGFAAATFFPVIIMGIFSKRMNKIH